MLESHADEPTQLQELSPKARGGIFSPLRSMATLWNAPLPNARFLIVSGSFWTVNLAITEPYRFLFFSRLGLSPEEIGKLFAADLAVRSIGLLLSGFTQRLFGAKRMLVGGDVISWVLPYLILGFSSRPWHIVLAVLLTSLNAFSSTPYNCLLAEGMPPERRTKGYAFLFLWNLAPSLLVPWFAGWLISSHPFGPTLRVLFLVQAACMAIGISWRGLKLSELQASSTSSEWGILRTFRELIWRPQFLAAWAALATAGMFQSLWTAFFAIYLSKHLHLPDTLPAWNIEISTIGFVVGTLAIQPFLGESKVSLVAAMALVFQALLIGGYYLHPGFGGVLSLGFAGGITASLSGAATSSLLTSSLPENARHHGFALSFVGVHLTGALCMPFAGHLLQSNLALFPALAIVFLLAWAASLASWSSAKGSQPFQTTA